MWDIHLTQKDLFDCFFGLVVSYAESYNLHYESSLLGTWGFRIDKKNDKIISNNCLKLLSKNHGIEVTERSLSGFNELYDFVNNKIKDTPIIVSIDAIDCSWCISYRKYHIDHFILVVDIKQDSFMCVDSYFSGETVNQINFNNFIEWSGTAHPICSIGYKNITPPKLSIFKEIHNQIIDTNMISNLYAFLNEIIERKAVETCHENYILDLYATPLIIRLKRLAEDRMCFIKGLMYMNGFYNNKNIEDLISNIKTISNLYTAFKNKILKQIMLNRPKYNYLSEQFQIIIEQEQKSMEILNVIISQLK